MTGEAGTLNDGGFPTVAPRDAALDSPVVVSGDHADAANVAGDAAAEAAEMLGDSGVPGPTVTIAAGALEGKLEGSTREFLGIPYAAPPLGALRFAAPKPFPAWQGTRPATTYGPRCPQDGYDTQDPKMPQSEDCLTLNVFAPEHADASKLPVMVFIHGGSGVSGAGSDYPSRWLSEAGPVVVVTINYRLGALATLTLPALDTSGVPSGNLAIRDQQLALTWVHDNIAAFGGEPGNVTLFGESFGSISTCFHIFARGSEALVQRFIMESGGCVGSAVNPSSRAHMEATSQDLVTALCPNQSDVAACLRGLPVSSLVNYKNTHGNVLEQFGAVYVDGVLLPAHPAKLAREGNYVHAPILLGTNLHETHFLESPAFGNHWPLVHNTAELTIGLSAMYPDYFLQLLGHYGLPADADANEEMVNIMDDGWFHCPARALSREVSAHGDPVYLYSFDLAPAVHTLELDYVFGWPGGAQSKDFAGAPVPPLPDLVTTVQSDWVNFAKTGDPNGSARAVWPKYTKSADQNLVLDRTLSVNSHFEQEDCDFWDTVLVEPFAQ